MGDMGEAFQAQREESRARRANNREKSAQLLATEGVAFTSHNGGAHLVVAQRVNFWPGTGLWIDLTTPDRGRGVRALINYLRRS